MIRFSEGETCPDGSSFSVLTVHSKWREPLSPNYTSAFGTADAVFMIAERWSPRQRLLVILLTTDRLGSPSAHSGVLTLSSSSYREMLMSEDDFSTTGSVV